jgi:hypothetical protein
MADQEQVEGVSRTSFSEAAQDAAKQIKELQDDKPVTFNVTRSSVTVGGNMGIKEYHVTLTRS